VFNRTRVFPSVPVAFTGQSLVSHAGARGLAGFVDALGFGRLCEERLGRFAPSAAVHGPGLILGSLVVLLASGDEYASDLDMLRALPGVLGTVPRTRPSPGSSNPPWRTRNGSPAARPGPPVLRLLPGPGGQSAHWSTGTATSGEGISTGVMEVTGIHAHTGNRRI
jgi:hypothetical protein